MKIETLEVAKKIREKVKEVKHVVVIGGGGDSGELKVKEEGVKRYVSPEEGKATPYYEYSVFKKG